MTIKLLLPICFLFFPIIIFSKPEINNYLDYLLKESDNKKIYNKKMWHIFLHYKKTLTGFESEADGKSFFFAKNGKSNPKDELKATLTAFFDENITETENYQHPQCQFKARYEWLKKELNFDNNFLKEIQCVRFEKWKKSINAVGITLIFTAAYLNNPASMFGHTFLRLDKKIGNTEIPLLSYIVNYSAEPTTFNPIIYSLYGLTGQFKGTFSTIPYYLKIKEYSSIEHRDIWEYKLNFTQEQIDRIVSHIWELGSTYFDYFYLKENCSYHILSLLETGDENFDFRKYFTSVTIPPDTIKIIELFKTNFITKKTYRPSLKKEIDKIYSILSKDERIVVKNIVEKENLDLITEIETERKAFIIDSSLKLYRYKTGYKLTEEQEKKLGEFENKLQTYRSKLKEKSIEIKIENGIPPEQSHGTSAIFSGFLFSNDKVFQQIIIRPSLHDMLSNSAGYEENSQIEMGLTKYKFSFYNGKPDYFFESFDFVKILAFSPIYGFTNKLSWKLNAGVYKIKENTKKTDGDIYYSLKGGPGISFSSNIFSRELYYSFVEIDLGIINPADNVYKVSLIPSFGMFFEFTKNWRFLIELGYIKNYFYDKLPENDYKLTSGTSIELTKSLELRFLYEKYKKYNEFIITFGFNY